MVVHSDHGTAVRSTAVQRRAAIPARRGHPARRSPVREVPGMGKAIVAAVQAVPEFLDRDATGGGRLAEPR